MLTLVKVPLGLFHRIAGRLPTGEAAVSALTRRSSSSFSDRPGDPRPRHAAPPLPAAEKHGWDPSTPFWSLIPPYVVFALPVPDLRHARVLPHHPNRPPGCGPVSMVRVSRGRTGRILLPLSLPVLATLAIIDVLATWNELLIALVLISYRGPCDGTSGFAPLQGSVLAEPHRVECGGADCDCADPHYLRPL